PFISVISQRRGSEGAPRQASLSCLPPMRMMLTFALMPLHPAITKSAPDTMASCHASENNKTTKAAPPPPQGTACTVQRRTARRASIHEDLRALASGMDCLRATESMGLDTQASTRAHWATFSFTSDSA